MFDPILMEGVLSTVFDYFKSRVVTTPSDRASFDFVLKGEGGEKIAIEIKGNDLSKRQILKLADILSTHPDIDEFVLITSNAPNKENLEFLNQKLGFKKSSWLSINEFLEKQYGININDNNDLSKLQVAAITSKIDNYAAEIIGNPPVGLSNKEKLINNLESEDSENKISSSLISLRRQFPDSILAKLNFDDENILTSLFIGSKYNDAIVILSDIKNFSTIVSAADAEDLNEAMSKYYSNARDLVFKHHGILDKFIGDAVLAIFNYPEKSPESYLNSLKFCAELVQLGRETLKNLLSKMDQSVDTGTRIGVSNGPIYTLNIGRGDIEITFIGDKINFAARLEKNCDLNGILISNRFYTKLKQEFPSLTDKLTIEKKDISPEDAKGQVTFTTAWQITESDIPIVTDYNIK